MRPAVEHGHAEPLAGADSDINAEIAGRLQDCQGEKVGGAHSQCLERGSYFLLFHFRTVKANTDPVLLSALNDLREVHDAPLGVRVLEEDPRDVLVGEVRLEDVLHLNVDAEGEGAGLDAAHGLRVQFVGEDKALTFVLPEICAIEMKDGNIEFCTMLFQ